MQRASRAAAAEEEKGPPPVGEAVKAYVQAIQALLQVGGWYAGCAWLLHMY